MLDLLITGGSYVDLEKKKRIEANIGIQDGKIVSLGDAAPNAARRIDASGQIVSAGFIDIHMHEEDYSLTKKKGYDIAIPMLQMGVTTAVTGNCGNNRQSLEETIDFINNVGNPVNYMSFIGNNFVRAQIGHEDRYTKASIAEIDKMIRMVEKAVELGAIGISYGLEYSPGVDYEEAIAIAQPIYGRKDMLLAAHYRRDGKYCIDSIDEMVQLGKDAGIPFQISHISSLSAFGYMKEALERIDHHIRNGADVMGDAYPYNAFSTFIGSSVFDEGSLENWGKTYSDIQFAEEPFKGQRATKESFEKVRRDHPNMLVIAHVMNDDEILMAIQHPSVMVASDGLYRNHSGHPRGAGTFPKVLGRYVRETGAMDLFDALDKMTRMPAKRLRLFEKGEIKEGYDADITIFDYDKILDNATFEDPQAPPSGIDYVILGGQIAVENGKIINDRLGRFIRRMP